MLVKYFISNLLFTGVYAIFAYTFVFSNEYKQFLNHSIILYGIYNSLQIGGIWILENVCTKYAYNTWLILLMRLTSIILIMFQNQITLILSFILLGLSSASYYGLTRKSMEKESKSNYKSINPYIAFSISTNLAFVIFPYLGNYLIGYIKFNLLITLAMIILLIISIIVVPSKNIRVDNLKSIKEDYSNERYESFHMYDLVRLGVFLIGYGAMISMGPLKIKSLQLSSDYVSYFYSIHSGLLILIQILLLKSNFLKFKKIKYEIINWLSLINLICAIISEDPLILFINIIIWTLCESYQVPAIEELIFSKRNYSSKIISRLLIIDGLISLLSPLMNKRISK